jgi:purine-binding chemotaxis protein CheW
MTAGTVLVDHIVFELGGLRVGLAAAAVREVHRAVTIVPLPGAPPAVEGVIDVRGELVAVLDLRTRFGIPPSPVRTSDHLVLARTGGRTVALRVESSPEWLPLPAAEIEPVTAIARGLPHVAGIARTPGGLVLIHDLDTFLSGPEAASLDAALGAAADPP